ncbi:APC family permease [Aurantiacibacter xanthus]|uniref:APC family permease n=1 Tax=Aurantiacibacter xanthus TaxID=1784712 RepID=A0A3A1P5M3_9SPHN|nr:APC family permease [Aurantiacibacter xanthus]RIV88461.1 APC family permease [Aurantiacibacter xanthus]
MNGASTHNQPPRAIGLAGAVLINLNGVIGSGIFALPALLYAGAGGYAPLVVLAYALLVAGPSLVYARLSTMHEQSGGPQLYVEHAFGPFAGFQAGWFLLGQNLAARAANFHVLVSYLAALFPLFDDPAIRLATIAALIALFTGLAAAGTRNSIRALWLGTLLKLGPILLICGAGLLANGVPTGFALPEFGEVESIALLLAYAYSGGALSTVVAGEVREARRTVYRSIFVNLALIAVLYAFVQWAYIAIDPQAVNADRPLASAGEAVFGPLGVALISVAAIFSTGANQLSYFVSMPRLIYGMASRGLLPALLARISPRFGTPTPAILCYAMIVLALALSGTFATLATYMVALETLVILLTVLALPMLWRAGEDRPQGPMLILWSALVLFALVFNLWLLAQVPLSSALPTLGVLAVGTLLYLLARRRA